MVSLSIISRHDLDTIGESRMFGRMRVEKSNMHICYPMLLLFISVLYVSASLALDTTLPNGLSYESRTLPSELSREEKNELIKLLHELFQGYSSLIKEITLDKVIFKNGDEFNWRPPKGLRTETDVLNKPSLIEQFLPIYVPGKEWQSHPDHDGHAGRFRELNFFKTIFGHSEKEVAEKLVSIKWLEKSFKNKTILVTNALNIADVFQQLSIALEKLPGSVKSTFLEEISGTFKWRVIAGTDRLSAHSFGMTLDLDCKQCEYWLWDYRKERGIDEKMTIKEENILAKDLPQWRNRVPFEIVEIFERHGFIWGGKFGKYDTMHFEYRPEFFVRPEVKQRLRQLLEKEGYELLPPLLNSQLIPKNKAVAVR